MGFDNLEFEGTKYYQQYFDAVKYPNNPVSSPEYRITTWSEQIGYSYGGFLWPYFLTEWSADTLIIRNIWYLMGSHPGAHLLGDIDSVLRGKNKSIELAYTEYAFWRFFTGSFAEGSSLKANLPEPKFTILTGTHNGSPFSENTKGAGGVNYFVLSQFQEVVNVHLSLDPIKSWDAKFVQQINYIPGNTLNVPITQGIGNLELVRNASEVSLVFVVCKTNSMSAISSCEIGISPVSGKRSVLFENKYGNISLGGQLRYDNNIVQSGFYYPVTLGNHSVNTQHERFTNPVNVKHQYWNNSKDVFALNYSMDVLSIGEMKAVARFVKLDPVKIQNKIEGSSDIGLFPIYFNDPWYLKSNGTQSGMNDYLSFTSPYEPTGAQDRNEKGVFLNQYPAGGDPHYSVKTITPQEVTVNNGIHKLYFQNWVSNTINGSPAAEFQDPNSLTTGVVFKSAGAEVSAVMKGTHLTNSNVALAQTGSRNIIREHYTGNLYLTYQSMDCIWLEKSTDNGTTWSLANGGKAISKVMAKNPAISILGSYAVITYQKLFESSSSGVMAKLYDLNTDIVIDSATIYSHSSLTMSDNLNPVVEGIVGCNRIAVVYTNPVQIYNFDIPGLYIDNIGIVWDAGQNHYRFSGVNGSTEYDTYITGTNTASVNPALSYRPGNSSSILHLVWQQSDNATGDEIMYLPVEFLSNGSINSIGEITCISSGCGYDRNINPTVTSIPGDDIPRVGWVGHRTGIEGEYGAINKPQANNSTLTTENVTEAVFRALDNNSSWSYGTDVRYVNINRTESVNGYALAWTQGMVPPFENKYFKNTAFYNEYPLTTTGGEIQLTNALNFTGMFGLSLNTAAQPYRFEQTNLIEAPAKEQYAERTAMRSGIIYNRKAQIVFSFGNIKVNNEPVLFPLIAEGVSVNSLERVNQYLLSDEFTLTDNSVFQYSINYRVTDTVNAVTALGTNGEVGFTLRLEDANTGEILGEYDRVAYNAHNVKQYARIDYQVNPEGIGNRTVRLRLTATTNTEMLAGLNTRVKRDNRLGKGLYKEISYKGGAVIKEYALSQNYPNPFNPSTSIRYQIPNAGNVKLVVYDVLGKEVATLVNKEQAPGSYTVIFDGSKLASGVYIYKLTAGNFTATKKLNLLK